MSDRVGTGNLVAGAIKDNDQVVADAVDTVVPSIVVDVSGPRVLGEAGYDSTRCSIEDRQAESPAHVELVTPFVVAHGVGGHEPGRVHRVGRAVYHLHCLLGAV